MAYASASDVAALTLNLLGSSTSYDTGTKPTLAQVNAWLSAGSAAIDAQLASRGYGTIPATSQAYPLATQVNALFGAWLAELSRLSARVTADERTRADILYKQMVNLLNTPFIGLLQMDLSRAGVAQTSVAYAGGQSVSDKAAVAGNADRVPERFGRGQFHNPLALYPTGKTSAS